MSAAEASPSIRCMARDRGGPRAVPQRTSQGGPGGVGQRRHNGPEEGSPEKAHGEAQHAKADHFFSQADNVSPTLDMGGGLAAGSLLIRQGGGFQPWTPIPPSTSFDSHPPKGRLEGSTFFCLQGYKKMTKKVAKMDRNWAGQLNLWSKVDFFLYFGFSFGVASADVGAHPLGDRQASQQLFSSPTSMMSFLFFHPTEFLLSKVQKCAKRGKSLSERAGQGEMIESKLIFFFAQLEIFRISIFGTRFNPGLGQSLNHP